MSDIFKKLNNYISIRNVSYVSLVLNLASIILGIIYLAIPIYSILWDIFGVILLICLFENYVLVYINARRLNKTTKLGNKLNLYCYFYLFFSVFAMLFMGFGNFIIVILYENISILLFFFYIIVFSGYFGLFGLAGSIAYVNIKNLDNRELWDLTAKGSYKPSRKILIAKKIIKILLGLLSILIIIITGVFLLPFTLIGSVVGQFGLFVGFVSISCTVQFLRMIRKRNHRIIFYTFGIIGLTVSGMMFIPLFLTPWTINNAEINFAAAFGNDWKDRIPTYVESTYFLQSQFWIPGFFLGIPPKDCEVRYQIPFFDGAISNYSVDKDIELYFDVYWPKGDSSILPGRNSTLIWIHGGSWREGDKGNYRVIYNKYFAAQGYIVYDIQYGLYNEEGGSLMGFLTPDYRLGNFNITDMVRHIGNFTQYISDPTNQYSASKLGANLSSTFIHGGSAGGHLTCATALPIWSTNYTNIFGSSLSIKGYLPVYPANNFSGLAGDPKFKVPENYFVNATSPPCLIYQGTSDLGCARVAERIKTRYTEAGNDKCAIIWFPLAGHATDLYFSGYYSLPFVYYMERFLYLCVNDLI